MNIKLVTNAKQVADRLKKRWDRVEGSMLAVYMRALEFLRAAEQRDLTSGKYGLKTRTGRLRNSLAIAAKRSGNTIIGVMGTGLPYAAAHEFGTTIRPKNVSWLTIPFRGIKGRAREYANTFFIERAGGLLLMQNQGGNVRPLFTLKKSVTLRRKEWMSKSFMAAKGGVVDIIQRGIREALA